MVDFSTYQPPGTYVEEAPTPLLTNVSDSPTVVALVGPAIGYEVHTEAIVLTGTSEHALSKLGIDPSSVVVRGDDGVAFSEGGDYEVSVTSGASGDVGHLWDNVTSISRKADGTIQDNQAVFVSYSFTTEDYFNPRSLADFDDIKRIYGEPLDLDTGAVISPLSLAAKVAIENGAANGVVLVATEPASEASRPQGVVGVFTTRSRLAAAYAKLNAMLDVSVVVPLPVGILGTDLSTGDTGAVGEDLATHVEQASASLRFRVGVLGYDRQVTVSATTTASSIDSRRVMLAWPWQLNYFNGMTNQVFEVGGVYLAAAYAGVMVRFPTQMPLTRKNIRGFSGLPQAVLSQMTESFKNGLSSGGVAVTEVEDETRRLVVRHGVTTATSTSNIFTREISLTRQRDRMLRSLRNTLNRSGLIGDVISDDTPNRVRSVVEGVLQTLVAGELIFAYNDLQVRIGESVDPTVVEVKFQYTPAYPLNYITVSFSINVQTGEFAEAA